MAGGTINLNYKGKGELVAYKMAASKTIYRGQFVQIGTDGLVIPAAPTGATSIVVGIANETKTSGASDTVYIIVRRKGIASLPIVINSTLATPTQTMVGQLVYLDTAGSVSADQEISLSAVSSSVIVGLVIGIDQSNTSNVLIDIEKHVAT